MRTIIFILLTLFAVQTVVAASVPLQPAGMQQRPPMKKALYSKGKGVVGLITGLALSALLILLILKNGGFNGLGKGSGGKGSGKSAPNIDFSNIDLPGPGSPKRKPPQPVPAL
jgi:hypothetical protein